MIECNGLGGGGEVGRGTDEIETFGDLGSVGVGPDKL